MMKRSQIISMDLVMGFVIFLIAISIFFYFLQSVPFISQKKTLTIESKFVFNNLETLPDHRIRFLYNNRVDERKLNAFAKLPYGPANDPVHPLDSDDDGIIDSRDPSPGNAEGDADGDKYTDYFEYYSGTNPLDSSVYPVDSDSDTLDDNWERRKFSGSLSRGSVYEAFDGITNGDIDEPVDEPPTADYNCDGESSVGLMRDANGNGILDWQQTPTGINLSDRSDELLECTIFGFTRFTDVAATDSCYPCMPYMLLYNFDKNHGDYDEDGLNDLDELNLYGTNPASNDTDSDKFADGTEITVGTNPSVAADKPADSNGDGLTNVWMRMTGLDLYTDPAVIGPNADPDRDGLTNFQEQMYDTDPLKYDTFGTGKSDFSEVVNPTKMDMNDLVLENINTMDFEKVDACIYFRDNSGNINKHIGPGNNLNIQVADGVPCGQGQADLSSQPMIPTASSKPQCKTKPSTNAISLSKPVFFKKADGTTQLLSMVVLICAQG